MAVAVPTEQITRRASFLLLARETAGLVCSWTSVFPYSESVSQVVLLGRKTNPYNTV